MIDNFEKFPREFKAGEFYFLQILERHKDNPDKKGLNGGNSCRVLKAYSIATQEELNKRIPHIKEMCAKYKARCYVHPARKSEKAIAADMIIMLGEYLKKSNHSLHRIHDSACGHNTGVERLWLIDVDTKDIKVVNKILKDIRIRSIGKKDMSSMYVLPTVNGFHIITPPFDQRILSGHDVHKNNPTLLYCDF